jgi:hypothetical protein
MSRRTATAVVEVDELTIDGKKIRVRHSDLDLCGVHLDPKNPRIANTVDLADVDTPEEIDHVVEELLWRDGDVRDLCRQVEINKGLVERIIIREDGRVVEGNCRTVCYRKLSAAHPREGRWRKIPARVLPPDIVPRDLAILLGEMHVAGKNTWTPFEKAGHVFRMHKELGLTQDEIALRLRMSKSKVNQLIKAFQAMKTKLLPKYPGTESIRKFSYFEELYKQPTLREWVGSNDKAEDKFAEWVGSGRLSHGLQVRELPAILAMPEALRALDKGGFEAALQVVAQGNPAVASRLLQKMLDMTEALRTANIEDVRRVKEQPAARRLVRDLSEALDHFLSLAGGGRA